MSSDVDTLCQQKIEKIIRHVTMQMKVALVKGKARTLSYLCFGGAETHCGADANSLWVCHALRVPWLVVSKGNQQETPKPFSGGGSDPPPPKKRTHGSASLHCIFGSKLLELRQPGE